MAITARTNLRGRLGVLIAGSLVVTALTASTAAASVPTPISTRRAPFSRPTPWASTTAG